MNLLLASASPRRKQLLLAAGVPLAGVLAPAIDEAPRPGERPLAYARRMAREKALAISSENTLLTADTVVHQAGVIFDKPRDPEHARLVLKGLSGRWHQVSTAWALRSPGGKPQVRVCSSRVLFRHLSPAEIEAYVLSGEGADKAGSYAVQGMGAALVDRVSGSYTNVIGLPLPQVLEHLAQAGIHPSVESP